MTTVLYDAPGPAARRRSVLWSVVGGIVVLGLLAAALVRLNSQGALDAEVWSIYEDPDTWTFLLDGLVNNLRAAAVAAVLAAAGGFLLAVLRRSDVAPVRWLATAVIEVFRGLPVVLMMFFGVIALGLSFFQGVVFGLAVYNAAVIAEILRAGIAGLPKGQGEAGEAIGLTRFQVLRIILLPQAIRTMLPSLISQFVVLLKDSSLGYIVGYSELLRSTRNLMDFFGSDSRFPLFVVSVLMFVAVNFTLGRVAIWVEKRGRSRNAARTTPVVPGLVTAGTGTDADKT